MTKNDGCSAGAEPNLETGSETETSFVHIAFLRPESGETRLRSIQVMGETGRVRFSFAETVPLEQVFEPQVNAYLLEILKDGLPDFGIVALDDRPLELPGLSLRNLRVMASQIAEGGTQVIFRFREFSGDIMAIFGKNALPFFADDREPKGIAIETLEEIFVPLSNLAAYINERIETADAQERAATINALVGAGHRIETLRSRVSVLKKLATQTSDQDNARIPVELAKISSG